MTSRRLGIIGGGASGIASAFYAAALGWQPEILECTSEIGGRIGGADLGARRIDFGGKNLGKRYRLFREFVASMGSFEYEHFGINTSSVVNGRLVSIDNRNKLQALWRLARMAGIRDFSRMLRLMHVVRSAPANEVLAGPDFRVLSERCDGVPLTAHFGGGICKHVLRPMTVRMNGSEPDEYFVGNLGSNIKMILDSYEQLSKGLHSVLTAFARTCRISLSHRVESLVFERGRVIGVRGTNEAGSFEHRYDAVVVATPAPQAAKLFETDVPELAAELRSIAYHPVGVAVVEYDRPVFHSNLRAVVFGAEHALSNAGAYGTGALDVARYTFSGRSARRSLESAEAEAQLIDQAETLLRGLPEFTVGKRKSQVFRVFREGLCAYGPYHHRRLDRMQRLVESIPDVTLTGDYVHGASIEACFSAAKDRTERLLQSH